MDIENLSGVILAGGRATRMGGNDKGLLKINSRALVNVVAEQFAPQVSRLMVNANRNTETYQELGFHVIEDEMADFQGPLAGMLTALKHCTTDWLITLPCDGPYVAKDYAEKMMTAAADRNDRNLQLAVATDGDRLQPVYAMLHRQLIDSLTLFLESGERKIDRWYASVGFVEVSFSHQLDMFTNLNTPEQLAAVQAT